jgi:hypothetical protein
LEIIYPNKIVHCYSKKQYNPVLKGVKGKPIAIWNVVVGETIGTADSGGKVRKRRQNGRFK